MLPVNNRNVGQPMAYLKKSGLAGLALLGQGDLVDYPPDTPVEAVPGAPAPDTSFWSGANLQTVGTVVNSEIGWLTNLVRSAQGKAPLPPSVSAPTVNVGVSDETRKLIIVGGVGLGAFLLLKLLKKGK